MQPTEFITRPTAPRPPARGRPRWPLIVAVGVLAAVLGVVGTLAVQKLTGPDGIGGTFTVHGSVEISSGAGLASAGQPCDESGNAGASDLAPGGQVAVYDAAGKLLAIGALGEGTLTGSGVCRMPFTVDGVSGGGPFFVEVTHRGRIAFTRAEAGDVQLSLSLP